MFALAINIQKTAFVIPIFQIPIYWYGVLFALGFYLTSWVFKKFLLQVSSGLVENKSGLIDVLIQSLSLYLVLAIVVGARIFHVAFYEGISRLTDLPFLLNIREGGLASHGAVFFILVVLSVFWMRKKEGFLKLNISFPMLLDQLTQASLIQAAFIRLGNLINQEILGKETSLPWGVVFLDPIQPLALVKRHPVQIYEALFYVALFFFLFTFKKIKKNYPGIATAVFFILLFGFRFWIESFKESQSVYDQFGLVGQWLSLPFILFGIIYAVIVYSREKSKYSSLDIGR